MSETVQPDNAGLVACNVLRRTGPGKTMEIAATVFLFPCVLLWFMEFVFPFTIYIHSLEWVVVFLCMPWCVLLFPCLWSKGELRVDPAFGAIEVKDTRKGTSILVSLADTTKARFHTQRRVEIIDLQFPGGATRLWSDNDSGEFPNEVTEPLNRIGTATISLMTPIFWSILRFFNFLTLLLYAGVGHLLLRYPLEESHFSLSWYTIHWMLTIVGTCVFLAANVVYALLPASRGARLLGFSGPGVKKWILGILAVIAALLMTGGMLRSYC